MYLIRRQADGTMRTLMSTSPRTAMQLFVSRYRPPKGEVYEVKEREVGDWEAFKVIR